MRNPKARLILSILLVLHVGGLFGRSYDSIPFRYTGTLHFASFVYDSIRWNLIFDTGGAHIFGIDTVFLAHSKWKPNKWAFGRARGTAGEKRVRVIAEPTEVNW